MIKYSLDITECLFVCLRALLANAGGHLVTLLNLKDLFLYRCLCVCVRRLCMYCMYKSGDNYGFGLGFQHFCAGKCAYMSLCLCIYMCVCMCMC